MGPASLVAVEVTDEEIKLAWLDRRRPAIRALERIPLAGQSQRDQAQLLRNSFEKCGIRPRRVLSVLVVGRHQTTVKMVRFPSVKEEEIARMASFQAVRHVPFSREEIVVDYERIAVERGGYSVVMLVIVPRRIIEHSLAVARGAGLEPVRACLSSQSLVDAYLAGLSAGDRRATVCLIDTDPVRTSVEVVHREKLIFTRSIALGTHNYKQDTEETERLVGEIQATLQAYRKQGVSPPLQRVVFTHKILGISVLSDRIETATGLRCQQEDVLSGFKWHKRQAPNAGKESEKHSYTALIGTAVQGTTSSVDLLPEEWRLRRQGQKRRRELIVSGIAALGLFLSLMSLGFSKLLAHRDGLAYLDARLVETGPKAQKVRLLSERLDSIQDALQHRHGCLEALVGLYQTVPPGVHLTLFGFEEGERVSLRGTTEDLSTVFETRELLEASPLFEKVEVKFATRRKRMNKVFTDFQIECPLKAVK